jgi:hypothetical protein
MNHEYTEDKPYIERVTVTYSQDNELQSGVTDSLTISTEDQGAGAYLVLKTKRWAVDKIDDLIRLLEDFKKRAGVEEDVSATATHVWTEEELEGLTILGADMSSPEQIPPFNNLAEALRRDLGLNEKETKNK